MLREMCVFQIQREAQPGSTTVICLWTDVCGRKQRLSVKLISSEMKASCIVSVSEWRCWQAPLSDREGYSSPYLRTVDSNSQMPGWNIVVWKVTVLPPKAAVFTLFSCVITIHWDVVSAIVSFQPSISPSFMRTHKLCNKTTYWQCYFKHWMIKSNTNH